MLVEDSTVVVESKVARRLKEEVEKAQIDNEEQKNPKPPTSEKNDFSSPRIISNSKASILGTQLGLELLRTLTRVMVRPDNGPGRPLSASDGKATLRAALVLEVDVWDRYNIRYEEDASSDLVPKRWIVSTPELLENVTNLVVQGADLAIEDDLGKTALHYAALMGYSEVAELLLSRGAQAMKDMFIWLRCEIDGEKWPLVSTLCAGPQLLRTLKRFLAQSASHGMIPVSVIAIDSEGFHTVEFCDDPGEENKILEADEVEPLYSSEAELAELLESVKSLVEQGADLGLEDDLGKTALHYAAFLGYCEVAELLLSRGAQAKGGTYWFRCDVDGEKWPLVSALCAGTQLLRTLKRVNVKQKDGRLREAQVIEIASDGYYTVMYEDDEDENEEEEDEDDEDEEDDNSERSEHKWLKAEKIQPFYSSEAELLERVTLLVELGAYLTVEVKDKYQKTALYYAVLTAKYVGVVQFLLNGGANASLEDEKGKTQLDLLKEASADGILAQVDFELSTLTAHGHCVWFHLLANDQFSGRVAACLMQHAEHVSTLAYCRDDGGRRAIDVATKGCKKALQDAVLFMQRYDLAPQCEHRSATCLLFYATDCQSDGKRVAVKLMRLRESFEAETQGRGQFDADSVIAVLHAFDGDNDPEFAQQLQRRPEFKEYNYCIVMPAASRNLNTILQQENVAGKQWDKVRQIARELTSCLRHVHERGALHGDVKPLNVMRTEEGRCLLIDLDASVRLGQPAGAKFSSAFVPPEMLYRPSSADDAGSADVRVKSEDCAEYERVVAAPSFDLWALGCVLFHLCAAEPLFPSSYDNLDQDHLRLVHEWSDDSDTKRRKLQKIADPQARNLVSRLLSKTPTQRPSLEAVLAHPFLSGKTSVRMVGEQAAFDVFLSYRVASDSANVERLYKLLTAAGLKVWWDKMCLKTGEPWQEGFCAGLVNSRHFVCLMSRGALHHPEVAWQNFERLGIDYHSDNVFLEFRLALELKQLGLVDMVVPVLIGDLDQESNTYGSFFVPGLKPTRLPELAVPAVETDLRRHMASQALGTPFEDSRTVKSVMDAMNAFQGVAIQGPAEQTWAAAAREIADKARKGQEGTAAHTVSGQGTEAHELGDVLIQLRRALAERDAAIIEKDALAKQREAELQAMREQLAKLQH